MYLDESYSHSPKPLVYTIAGFVSHDWRWRRFEAEWDKALTAAGLDYFHMAEFAHRKGIYESWTEKKRQKFLRNLQYIIHSNTIIDFANSVVVADYDELITPDIRYGFGEPHVFATIACLKDIAVWVQNSHLGEKDRISYVFEQGTVHDKTLRVIFERYMNSEQEIYYRLGGWDFRDKKEVTPLQSADMLAYENMLEMRRRIDPDNARNPRASIINLERPQSEWGHYGKKQLLEILSHPAVRNRLPTPVPTSESDAN